MIGQACMPSPHSVSLLTSGNIFCTDVSLNTLVDAHIDFEQRIVQL